MSQRDGYYTAGVLFLILLSLLTGIDHMELRGEEPRRAVITLEMMIRNNLIKPELLGWDYYAKPPVYNWILYLFYSVFNSSSEWVSRLPGVLSYIGTGVLIYLAGKKYIDRVTGVISAFIFLVSIDLYFYGSVVAAEIDLFYTLIIALQLFTLYHFRQKKAYYALFSISYALVAIGVLTKGLPSIFHQGVSLVAMAVYYRDYRMIFHPGHLVGLAVFFIFTGGYFYAYGEYGNSYNYLVSLWYESVEKSGADNTFGEVLLGLILFPLKVLYLLLPGSLVIAFVVWKKPGFSRIKNHLITFCLLIVAVNIFIYWISPDVKNRYLYILFPFLALILGRVALATGLRYHTLIIAAGVMAVLRLTYNFVGIPIQQNEFVYRDHSKEILSITGEEKIYYYDDIRTAAFEVPEYFNLTDVRYDLPANISYRLAYYLTRGNDHVLQFTPEIKRDGFYLVKENNMPAVEHTVLYVVDRGKEDDVVLIRVE